MPTTTKDITEEVLQELESAEKKFGPFNSAHEGYAVILEELDELWEAVKLNPKNIDFGVDYCEKVQHQQHQQMMREEAIQVAAMAIRFVKCICDEEF